MGAKSLKQSKPDKGRGSLDISSSDFLNAGRRKRWDKR